jgi:hypothetical protein
VTEAESQAVLTTLTEQDFQDAFKSGISAGNGAYGQKEIILRVIVVSSPKVSLCPDGSTTSGNYRSE